MSTQQVEIVIAAAQLLFAAFIFFRIDHRIFRRFMKRPKTEPELPLGLPIKSNRRAKLVLILIFGGLAFSGYGFYRTLQYPQFASEKNVNERNIESKIKEWLESYSLGVTTQKPP